MTTVHKADINSKLPSRWILTSIGGICDVNPRFNKPSDFDDGTLVSFVPMAAVDEIAGTIANPEIRPVGAVWHGYTRFREGDVIFAKITPSMENGKAAIANNLVNGIGLGTTEFHVLSPTDPFIAKWIYHYIRQESFRGAAAHVMTGTAGQLRVPTDFVIDAVIPLAPYEEIKRIVNEIEAQFSRLDSWLEVMQKLHVQLPRFRASILKAAVEGRLIVQDPNDEPADALLQRVLDERRQKWEEDYLANLTAQGKSAPKDGKWKEKYLEPLPPDTNGLPNLPDGWTWAAIEQVGEVRLGRQRSPDKRSRDYPTKYIRAANITEQGLDLSDVLEMEFTPEEREIYRLRRNDILVSEASGSPDQVGKSAIWNDEIENCCFQNTVIRLRAPNFDSRYLLIVLKHFYQSGVMARTAGGVGINHLSASRFARLPLPLAPENQQTAIVNEVNAKLSLIERLEETIRVNVKRAERMRQSILKQAFEGRLVGQDPDDEPANELLERIQLERVRRAEEEAQKPKQPRIPKMNVQAGRKTLYETLKEAARPLSARELFQQAGYAHETIDDFYEELREAVYESRTIRTLPQGNSDEIFLEVTG